MKINNDLKTAIYGLTLGTVVGLSLISFGSDKEELGKPISISDVVDDDYKVEQPEELKIQLIRLNNAKKFIEKNKVLNNFNKCDTLEDILKRQNELESLNLTDEDKIYKDCKATAAMQHFIYEQSIVNKVPFDYMMSIVYAETRGQFNSSGVIGYNSDTNFDIGYTQQNNIASLPLFKEKYNLTYEEAYSLLLNNDYANVCAAFIVVDEISKRHSEYDAYEYAGCYNGWLGWRNYATSQDYVYNHFSKAYDEVFTEHHSIELTKYDEAQASKEAYAIVKK